MLGLWPWKLLNRNTPINRPGVDWFNGVTRALTTMEIRFWDGEYPRIVRDNTNGRNWVIEIPRTSAESLIAFRCSLSGDNLTVTSGYVAFHGRANVSVDEDTLQLIGSESYIYVKYEYDGGAEILQASAFPVTTTDQWRFALCKCVKTGTTWAIDKVYHEGIINITPVVA